MADDINKNITIAVNLESDDMTKNIASLNTAIDSLLDKQNKLSQSGQQNTAAFSAVASQLEKFQSKLKDLSTQVTTNAASLNTLNTAANTLGNTLTTSAAQHQKTAEATGAATIKTKELSTEFNNLGQVVKQQSAVVSDSKTSFDAHKKTMEHLKKSFDEVKGVSGTFGPSLQDAAKAFPVMKSGLKLMEDGFKGVGTAIKADGFEFLLQILQALFDAFANSTNGSKILRGAISAVGVIVNKVKGALDALVNVMITVFSHPIESIKAFGNMVEQNIVNRFKAFSKILDGIIHLDFKKVADGTIQAATGITNATDKIGKAYIEIRKGTEETVGQMVKAYKKGYNSIEKNVNRLTNKLKEQNKVQKAVAESSNTKNSQNDAPQRDPPLSLVASSTNSTNIDINKTTTAPKLSGNADDNILATNTQEGQQITKEYEEKLAAKKKDLKDFEDYAKQSAQKIATDGFKILGDSIKQQADAKVAALEKDKASELSNKNLTSAQKLAIEQKYQKQEGDIKTKAFKEQQELSIAQAIINGAEAVTKVSAQGGILAALEVGVVIAETAEQVAKITAQKPPAYAKGGLHYTSDGRGGVLAGYSKTDNTNAYLRSGEGVVVSEAMQVPWARNLVSAINVGFGGRDFSVTNPGRGYAVGGIFTDGGDANRYYNQPVNDQKNLANTIAYQMINNFPPVYVDVKDINNQQNILAQTINRVNL